MKVSLQDVPEGGFSLDIEEGLVASDLTFLEPVRGTLEIRLHKKEIIISGRLTTSLSLNCGRCLKDYSFPVDTGVSIYARTEEVVSTASEDDEEGGAESPEDAHIKDGEIDVTGILLEHVALEIPIKQLCSEECKGFCPKCGADRNVSPCGCNDEQPVDPRFAKLKDFKTNK